VGCAKTGRLLTGLAAFGVFVFGSAVPGVAHSSRPTGTVVGGIPPCEGIGRSPFHFVAGTVVALRGSITEQAVDEGIKVKLPHAEVALQTVGDNDLYRFTLSPGRYVLHVVRSRLASELPFVGVTIKARHTIHVNMDDPCK
jgi:hypothetical protein